MDEPATLQMLYELVRDLKITTGKIDDRLTNGLRDMARDISGMSERMIEQKGQIEQMRTELAQRPTAAEIQNEYVRRIDLELHDRRVADERGAKVKTWQWVTGVLLAVFALLPGWLALMSHVHPFG